ncbi:predicted protein [Streptomyces viridosporus ATCC 14672]|uniref:Predicted protein n=1 Tax=Streptomyces viridosporus (strain ATCC 14672 / DSM 40746 / JCM 4963 / KCTC 9882 / NRRL B-12104 / FH 1290) TaxID=566461 RepID=D6A9F0_STRV1|nr:predicted protein [Streptomyces viridosporus ATCC 14672]
MARSSAPSSSVGHADRLDGDAGGQALRAPDATDHLPAGPLRAGGHAHPGRGLLTVGARRWHGPGHAEGPAWEETPLPLTYLNAAQAAHPAYARSLEVLREMNVMIGIYEPHRPKAGGGADRFRWEEALDLLEPRLGRRA